MRLPICWSATAFHWVDQVRGMAVIRRVLRPGGWVALWWTRFFDRSKPDPFLEATSALVPKVSAEFAEPGRPEFPLDRHPARASRRLRRATARRFTCTSETRPGEIILCLTPVTGPIQMLEMP